MTPPPQEGQSANEPIWLQAQRKDLNRVITVKGRIYRWLVKKAAEKMMAEGRIVSLSEVIEDMIKMLEP